MPERVSLHRHPASRGVAVSRIEVEITRSSNAVLEIRYRLDADMQRLLLPARVAPGRADDLWRHTCLEAFVREGAAAGYSEFNFAPSMEWAAYGFEGYREGMRDLPESCVISLSGAARADGYDLLAVVRTPPASTDRPWKIGLCAIIEDADGDLAYWAIAHAPGKPDFHHPDSFALELPPVEPS